MRKQQQQRKGGFPLMTVWIQGEDSDSEERLVKRAMAGRMSDEEEDEGEQSLMSREEERSDGEREEEEFSEEGGVTDPWRHLPVHHSC